MRTSWKLAFGIVSLFICFKYKLASIISFPFVFRTVKCVCSQRYMSVFLSNFMWLSSCSVTSPSVIARWTKSWIKSSRPPAFMNKTLVKFVFGFAGKIPTPLKTNLTFLSFRDWMTFFHRGRSSSDLSRSTIRVTCIVLRGTKASRSFSSITHWITLS